MASNPPAAVQPTKVNLYVIGRGHAGKSTLLNLLYRRLTQLNIDPYPVMNDASRGTVFLRVMPLSIQSYGMTLRLCDTAGLRFTKETMLPDMHIVRRVRQGLSDNVNLLQDNIGSMPLVAANEAHAFLIVLRADEMKWVHSKNKYKLLDEPDMTFLGSLREECKFLAHAEPGLVLTCCDLAPKKTGVKRPALKQYASELRYTKALFLTGMTKTKTGALELDEESKPDMDMLIRWITQSVLESVKNHELSKRLASATPVERPLKDRTTPPPAQPTPTNPSHANYPGQPQPGYPRPPQPPYPGQPQVSYVVQTQPNYPGQPQPNYPGQPQPNYPGPQVSYICQPQPNFPGQPPQPGYPGQPRPQYYTVAQNPPVYVQQVYPPNATYTVQQPYPNPTQPPPNPQYYNNPSPSGPYQPTSSYAPPYTGVSANPPPPGYNQQAAQQRGYPQPMSPPPSNYPPPQNTAYPPTGPQPQLYPNLGPPPPGYPTPPPGYSKQPPPRSPEVTNQPPSQYPPQYPPQQPPPSQAPYPPQQPPQQPYPPQQSPQTPYPPQQSPQTPYPPQSTLEPHPPPSNFPPKPAPQAPHPGDTLNHTPSPPLETPYTPPPPPQTSCDFPPNSTTCTPPQDPTLPSPPPESTEQQPGSGTNLCTNPAESGLQLAPDDNSFSTGYTMPEPSAPTLTENQDSFDFHSVQSILGPQSQEGFFNTPLDPQPQPEAPVMSQSDAS
ncbi:hypothetical protein Pelo_14184 [Pelomyxa schiedti]|nr:hypothetical protein Pelo_14184 [Pelomyxa schiedti]